MTQTGTERETQNRLIEFFQSQLKYEYLGNRYGKNNKNIEEEFLIAFLKKKRVSDSLISSVIHEVSSISSRFDLNFYHRNKEFYKVLRYGVQVKQELSSNYDTIPLIDWDHPEENHFGIAEEVSIQENSLKRPDIVLYVNGIALGVIELKKSTVSVSEGIRQHLTNQSESFIQNFFTTVQFLFVGNTTEGLRYGTIQTPETHFLKWKEDNPTDPLRLEHSFQELCSKDRFLELIHDFVLFDAGIKKVPRYHQYFGIKSAQEHILQKQSGIIWHTQGSGKSIVMVLLAKWIIENYDKINSRILIITDREELDKQIERVFADSEVKIKRSLSGRDLLSDLALPSPLILCTLLHKFGNREMKWEDFLKLIEKNPPSVHGDFVVFVDECHRTQSGVFHKAMKKILNNSVFIGFTGTPLMKKDKKTSLEVFGKSTINNSPYIHTYKFNEAVADKVVLDLIYESRDIDQRLGDKTRVDQWFQKKTENLNEFQKVLLLKKWGTLQKIYSTINRIEKIVLDIENDYITKPRFSSSGNAILIADSIYDACRYFMSFQNKATDLKEKVAIITSYSPSEKDIINEETGTSNDSEKKFVYDFYKKLLNGDFSSSTMSFPTTPEKYIDEAKNKFISEPINMKVLIVVDKLLTGFDAPPCSYIYLDRSLQDHGLFQAICRTNRLDSEDKTFGQIIDYMDLFKKVKGAISVYTSELDSSAGSDTGSIDIQERLKKIKSNLLISIEKIESLLEPIPNRNDESQVIRHFCGNPEIKEDLDNLKQKRLALYIGVTDFVRAYANIEGDWEEAGFSNEDKEEIDRKKDFYISLRIKIKLAACEILTYRTYDIEMRNLLDRFVIAEDPQKQTSFFDTPLLDLITNEGIEKAMTKMTKSTGMGNTAASETILNNVRRKIIDEYAFDPSYYQNLSNLLENLLKERKNDSINYQKFLKKLEEIIKKLNIEKEELPSEINTPGLIALYHNLQNNSELAILVHRSVMHVAQDGFRGNPAKERVILAEIKKILRDDSEVRKIFEIIKNHEEYGRPESEE